MTAAGRGLGRAHLRAASVASCSPSPNLGSPGRPRVASDAKLSAGLRELQAFSPLSHVVILLAGVVNRSRVAGLRRHDCNRAPILLFFLSVGVKLLEEGEDVVDFLIGLETWEYHLGTRDLGLRRLDVIPERGLIPPENQFGAFPTSGREGFWRACKSYCIYVEVYAIMSS